MEEIIMSKYKVYFEGYVYVEAENEDEALELAQEGFDVIYEEKEFGDIEEVDEYTVCFKR
jgi:N-acetyl-beta-hexosaminidase